jgi:hypothetical protein
MILDDPCMRILTLGDCKGWRPLVPQDIKTDRAVGVDVGVIDLGREADLGRLEGVVGGESDGKEKDAASVGRVTLRSSCRVSMSHYRGRRVRRVRTGPIIVACHWNMLSPVGPALHDEGGSRPRSINSCSEKKKISQPLCITICHIRSSA